MIKNDNLKAGDTITCDIKKINHIIHALHVKGYEFNCKTSLIKKKAYITINGKKEEKIGERNNSNN